MTYETKIKAAAEHLKQDPVLAPIIAIVGLCTIQPHQSYYQELVESIIGQQLSIKAAAAVTRKFLKLFNDQFPRPEQIVATDIETLRSAGLSQAKAAYVRDLAQHIIEGRLEIEKLPSLSNQEIIAELTAVKGIGEWTAHMFLMFSLGRLDILAWGDLGVKNGIKKLYNLEAVPTPDDIRTIAKKNSWHPYESVACWYVWQSLKPEVAAQLQN